MLQGPGAVPVGVLGPDLELVRRVVGEPRSPWSRLSRRPACRRPGTGPFAVRQLELVAGCSRFGVPGHQDLGLEPGGGRIDPGGGPSGVAVTLAVPGAEAGRIVGAQLQLVRRAVRSCRSRGAGSWRRTLVVDRPDSVRAGRPEPCLVVGGTAGSGEGERHLERSASLPAARITGRPGTSVGIVVVVLATGWWARSGSSACRPRSGLLRRSGPHSRRGISHRWQDIPSGRRHGSSRPQSMGGVEYRPARSRRIWPLGSLAFGPSWRRRRAGRW